MQAPDICVNLNGHGEGDGQAPVAKKHPSKKSAPKKRGVVYDDSDESGEDQQGQLICVFQGKGNGHVGCVVYCHTSPCYFCRTVELEPVI